MVLLHPRPDVCEDLGGVDVAGEVSQRLIILQPEDVGGRVVNGELGVVLEGAEY